MGIQGNWRSVEVYLYVCVCEFWWWCVCLVCDVGQMCSDDLYNSLRPHGLWPASLLCPWNLPGKNTGVGCHFLLQRVFPTQILNLGLLHWQVILYHCANWEAIYIYIYIYKIIKYICVCVFQIRILTWWCLSTSFDLGIPLQKSGIQKSVYKYTKLYRTKMFITTLFISWKFDNNHQ